MAFIEESSLEEGMKDEEIPQIRKRFSLKKSLPYLLAAVALGGYFYLKIAMNDDETESVGITEKRLEPRTNALDWSTQISDKPSYIETKVAETKEYYHEKEPVREERKPKKYKPFSNKGKRQSYKNSANQAQPSPTITNTSQEGGFDQGKYLAGVLNSMGQKGSPKQKTLDERLDVDQTNIMTAYIQKNLDKKILQGKNIPAVVDNSIQTDLPGMLRAIIQHNIYSEDGSRIIFPGGSQVIGQYVGGMLFGVAKLFVVWQRIKTGETLAGVDGGLDITINSPGMDSLGRSGQSMYIDSHFLERFGSSLLLSVLNAGVSIAGGLVTNGDQNTVQGIQQNLNKSSEMALRESLKIQPTGYAQHGSSINIFVARDLDFSNIFVD